MAYFTFIILIFEREIVVSISTNWSDTTASSQSQQPFLQESLYMEQKANIF